MYEFTIFLKLFSTFKKEQDIIKFFLHQLKTIINLILQEMTSKILTHIHGVDVSDYHVVELNRENLISAGFEKCPKNHRHMLLHAVQFQQPVPSPASMARTEKRNQLKAQQKIGEVNPPPKPRRKATRKIKGSRKRLAPTSLPPSASNFGKPKTATVLNAIKHRSPEYNVLKAARQACEDNLEAWFGKDQSKPESLSQAPIVRRGVIRQRESKGDKDFPIYFQKRHRSHKRRMRERWELIKANRDKLVELYGFEILRKECRISIQDVKRVLGLVEGEKMDVEEVGEFLAMVNEDDESHSSYSSSYSHSPSHN